MDPNLGFVANERCGLGKRISPFWVPGGSSLGEEQVEYWISRIFSNAHVPVLQYTPNSAPLMCCSVNENNNTSKSVLLQKCPSYINRE